LVYHCISGIFPTRREKRGSTRPEQRGDRRDPGGVAGRLGGERTEEGTTSGK